jgi:hypothetical protein
VTYEEIDEEIVRILSARQGSLPTHARAVFGAFMQWTSGLAVIEHCAYCKGSLFVTNLNDQVWAVSCPCGRSSDTLRGL